LQISVVQGPAKGRTYLLGPFRVVIGRDQGADVQLADPRVSRRHAEIRPCGAGSWVIQDLGSTNLTLHNGENVDQAKLSSGDSIIVGDTELKIEDEPSSNSPGEVTSMRVDAESLRRTLSDGGDWSVGGKQLQEGLFQIGQIGDPIIGREEIVRRAIPIVEDGVPFTNWAWLQWPDGLEQPFTATVQQTGDLSFTHQLHHYDTLVKRATRHQRAIVSALRTPPQLKSSVGGFDNRVSAMAIPLLARGEEISVLLFERDFRIPPFRSEDLAWGVALTAQLTVHLENARLFANLQGAHERLRHSQGQFNRWEKLALIGRLATGFAHDLNNPLTSLLGFLELSQKQTVQLESVGKLPEHLHKAYNAADYCRALCRNLLALARQSPFSDGEIEPIPVRETIERSLEICSDVISKVGAEIELELADNLPVEGDASTLQQIMMNLIVNAAESMSTNPPGSPRVIGIKASMRERRLLLEVSDTGPGIPKDRTATIFKPMVTTKESAGGTGLGLYVVHRIVNETGGSIEVESELGVRTIFRLVLGERLHRLSSEEVEPVSIPAALLEEELF